MGVQAELIDSTIDPSLCVQDSPETGVPWHRRLMCGPNGRDGNAYINFYTCANLEACTGQRMRDNPAEFIGPCALAAQSENVST